MSVYKNMNPLSLYFLILFIFNYVSSFDPSIPYKACLERGGGTNNCIKQVLESFRSVMKTGVPELSLPPMEPLSVDHIEFKLFEATVEFNEALFSGFQNMIVKSSIVDKNKKTLNVKLRLPKMSASANYALYGTIPPNLDLERSSGPARMNGNNVDLLVKMNLGATSGGKIDIKDMDVNIDLNDMEAELECLFPKNGRCCPRKYLKSCNTILSKTVHRLVNSDSQAFIKRFQPEISSQVSPVLKNYVSTALRNVEASDVI